MKKCVFLVVLLAGFSAVAFSGGSAQSGGAAAGSGSMSVSSSQSMTRTQAQRRRQELESQLEAAKKDQEAAYMELDRVTNQLIDLNNLLERQYFSQLLGVDTGWKLGVMYGNLERINNVSAFGGLLHGYQRFNSYFYVDVEAEVYRYDSAFQSIFLKEHIPIRFGGSNFSLVLDNYNRFLLGGESTETTGAAGGSLRYIWYPGKNFDLFLSGGGTYCYKDIEASLRESGDMYNINAVFKPTLYFVDGLWSVSACYAYNYNPLSEFTQEKLQRDEHMVSGEVKFNAARGSSLALSHTSHLTEPRSETSLELNLRLGVLHLWGRVGYGKNETNDFLNSAAGVELRF